MTDQIYGEMHPIYEAMSVCSGTLQWLDQQEQERSDWALSLQLVTLGKTIQEFIDANRSGKMAVHAATVFPFLVFCLGTVIDMTRLISRRVRNTLSERSDRFRQQIDMSLVQLEELTEKTDEIKEAWEMSLDPELASRIEAALRELDRTKTDIPNWRDTLEAISQET